MRRHWPPAARPAVVAEPGVLDEVARGTQLEGAQHLLVVFHHGDDDGLGRGPHGLHHVQQLEALAVAQVQVDQHHVELVLANGLAPLSNTSGLGHDQGARVVHDFLGNDHADVGIVIDQQHAHGLVGLARQIVWPHGGTQARAQHGLGARGIGDQGTGIGGNVGWIHAVLLKCHVMYMTQPITYAPFTLREIATDIHNL